jgi:hypothetical protein
MSYKIVYQTNLDGVYVGEERAFESPLEPGIYPIPAGAVQVAPPAFNQNQQAIWTGTDWAVVDKSIVEPPVTLITWNGIRAQRDSLLSDTDWVALKDITLPNEQEWFDYRQALRDIPQTYSEPTDVVWPTRP